MDNALLAKLMEKKKNQSPMDENEKNARMSMLQALKSEMHGMMADDLKSGGGLKKVEVAADNKDDLAKGLDKAKDLVGGASQDDAEDAIDGGLDEASEDDKSDPLADMTPSKDAPSDASLSPEEIDTLMALLAKMKASKSAL